MPVNVLLKLYDIKLNPVLLYGAEDWGLKKMPVLVIFSTKFVLILFCAYAKASSNAI